MGLCRRTDPRVLDQKNPREKLLGVRIYFLLRRPFRNESELVEPKAVLAAVLKTAFRWQIGTLVVVLVLTAFSSVSCFVIYPATRAN